jgi:hypothetical protein
LRFRFREPPVEEATTILHTILTREKLFVPEFVFVEPNGRRHTERICSIKVYEKRMRSALKLSGALAGARA